MKCSFDLSDAVMLADFLQTLNKRANLFGKNQISLEKTIIDSPEDAAKYLSQIEKGHFDGEYGLSDPQSKTTGKMYVERLKKTLIKLTDEDTFKKIADINDDAFTNDVEIEDLVKGFVKKDVYLRMKEEAATGKQIYAKLEERCPEILECADEGNDNTLCECVGHCFNSEDSTEDDMRTVEELAAYVGIYALFYDRYDLGFSNSELDDLPSHCLNLRRFVGAFPGGAIFGRKAAGRFDELVKEYLWYAYNNNLRAYLNTELE